MSLRVIKEAISPAELFSAHIPTSPLALFKTSRPVFSGQGRVFATWRLFPASFMWRTLGCYRYSYSTASPLLERPDSAGISQVVRERPLVLLPPSREQQVAIDTLLNTSNNLTVEACAGSGKTTTILHLAHAAPDTKFLVLVYNRRLMLETDDRVQGLGLRNTTVLNYHALGARYYTSECATDQGLKRAVQDDMPVIEGMELPEFSILVMDEQQDMTPILKRFVDKIVRDRNIGLKRKRQKAAVRDLRVVVLGDRRQEVYGFNNADSRFLTMASRPEIFGYINDHPWTSADQSTSNRVTQQNVDFINQQMLKRPLGEAMRAVKTHDKHGVAFPKPRYVVCDPTEDLIGEVLRLLGMRDLTPTDIIVLAPSVRGSSPAIYLANELALKGIPVFRSDSDVSDIAPEVARGKVLICTYHQAKGIERKASIVLGFDQHYHTWYNKLPNPPTATSNPQYVAATRALEHLVLVHDHTSAPLPFVDLDTVGDSCDLVITRPLQIEEPEVRRGIPGFSMTALCRNVSETLITACLQRLEVHMVAAPAYGVQPPIPKEIEDRAGLLEGVSAITGTAVPAIFQWRQRRQLAFLPGLFRYLEPPKRQTMRPHPLRRLPKEYYERLEAIEEAYNEQTLTTEDILYLSTFAMAEKDKDITKILAIPLDAYTWVSEAHCRDIHYTLNNLPAAAKIPGRGIFFESMRHRKFPNITHGGGPVNPEKKSGVKVAGVMDVCRPGKSNRTVWEIKYTESLQPEHVLQVAIYMLLLGESASGFLVSARTGQTVQVAPRSAGSLLEVLQLLVDAKSGGEQNRLLNTYSDEEFLDQCRRNFEDLVDDCALPPWFAMKPVGSKFQAADRPKRRRTKRTE